MFKNLQKHWDFRKCAGLRRVVSLSSMRARAWKTTKVPSATRRTRCNRSLLVTKCSSPVRSPNETLRTALCSPAIDPGLRVEISQLQHAFECRTTLRTDARSVASRPSHRPSHSSQQWANGGHTTRLPLWHSQAPNDGSSPKNQRVLGPREQPQMDSEFVSVTHCPKSMNHQLKTFEFELLCNVMADIETFIELSDRLQRSDERFVRAIREVGVPFTPSSWKRGSITSAQKMAYTRAVRRLEQSGFIHRISESKRDRTTHVRPTETAIAFMIDQLGSQIDCDQLFGSISRFDWCGNLVGKSQRMAELEKIEDKVHVE